MSRFNLSVLDALDYSKIAGLDYESIFDTDFEDFGNIIRNIGTRLIDTSSGSPLFQLFDGLLDNGSYESFTTAFCGDILDSLMATVEVPTDARNALVEAIKKIDSGNEFANNLACGLSIIFFLLSYVRGLSSGVETTVVRGMNSLILPNTVSPAELLTHIFRTEDNEENDKLRRELGIGDRWWEVAKSAAKSRAGIGELAELFRRGTLSDQEMSSQLSRLGIQSDTQQFIVKEAARPIPNIADIDRMIRTGRVDNDKVVEFLGRQGYREDDATHIIDASRPAFDTRDIIRLALIGKITPEEFNDWMTKRGWGSVDRTLEQELAKALPPIEELREAVWRGNIDEPKFDEYLKRHGLQSDEAKLIKDNSQLLYTPTDLIRFGLREIYTPAVAERFRLYDEFPDEMVPDGERIGLSQETMEKYWAAHWQLPAPGQGFEMFHRGIIDRDDLSLLLRALDVMPFWRDKMIELSYNVVPRRVVNTLFRDGIIGNDQFLDYYAQLGFSPLDAQRVWTGEVFRLDEPEREATKADILTAFVIGSLNEQQARDKLASLNFSGDAINLLIRTARIRRDLMDDDDGFSSGQDPDPTIPAAIRNDILRAYREDLIDANTASNLLTQFGLPQEDIFSLLAHEDNDRQFRDVEHELKQLRRMFDVRAIEDRTIADRLSSVGILPEAQRRTMRRWTQEREADEAVAGAKRREPTKADLRDWLVKGIIDPVEWSDRMVGLGYDEESTEYFLLEIISDVNANP